MGLEGFTTLVLCAVVGAAGCSSDAAREPPPLQARDSAGIRIVESARPAWNEEEAWRLAPDPELTVGQAAGASPYLLGRVAGAVRRPEGGLVVADGLSRELRFYDARGGFEFTVGGPGEGPGEFGRSLRSLDRCGHADLLFAFEVTSRTSVFRGDGTFLRRLPQIVTEVGGPPTDVACGPGPKVLVTGYDPDIFERLVAGASVEGAYREHVPLTLHRGEEGTLVAKLGLFPGFDRVDESVRALTRWLVRDLDSASVWVGTGERHELAAYDSLGRRTHIVRWAGRDLTLTPQDLERYLGEEIELAAPDRRAELAAWLRSLPAPDLWPAYRSLRIDPLGHLWVEEYPRSRFDPVYWTVLDRERGWLGRVELPPTGRWFARAPAVADNLTVTEIGADYVVGIATDDLGVDQVKVYPLLRRK